MSERLEGSLKRPNDVRVAVQVTKWTLAPDYGHESREAYFAFRLFNRWIDVDLQQLYNSQTMSYEVFSSNAHNAGFPQGLIDGYLVASGYEPLSSLAPLSGEIEAIEEAEFVSFRADNRAMLRTPNLFANLMGCSALDPLDQIIAAEVLDLNIGLWGEQVGAAFEMDRHYAFMVLEEVSLRFEQRVNEALNPMAEEAYARAVRAAPEYAPF